MSKILVLPGTIVGRAHLDHPKDAKGEPDVQAIVDGVTLTIQPTTTAITSGEFKVVVDDLHTEEFPRDSSVELIVAPQGWKAATEEGNDVQALLQANAAFAKTVDAATKDLQTKGVQITSLQSQLTVMTQRAEAAEATVAVRDGTIASRDGEITTLKAELARAQNALAAKPTLVPSTAPAPSGTTAPAAPTTIPVAATTTAPTETKS